MIYNDKFAYIHVPRTAGITIKAAIQSHYNDVVKPYEEDISGRLRMYQPYWYWEELIPDLSNRWVFSTVRNPYKRAVSLWKYTTQDMQDYANYLKGVSFKNFWDLNIKDLAPLLKYNIRSTQCEFLSSIEGDLVPNIFRIEDQLNGIERKLEIDITKRLNVSKSYNYKTYYNKDSLDIINDVFEEDFRQFGYDRKTYDTF
jgi:hypothetical protein